MTIGVHNIERKTLLLKLDNKEYYKNLMEIQKLI